MSSFDIINRILRLERVRGRDLLPSPDNWRIHTDEQKRFTMQLAQRIGFVGAVLVREVKHEGEFRYQLIDGDMRAGLFPNMMIPALVTDLDEQEAKEALLTMDPTALMANTDVRALHKLVQDIDFSLTDVLDLDDLEEQIQKQQARLAELEEMQVGDVGDVVDQMAQQMDVPMLYRCPYCQHEFEESV